MRRANESGVLLADIYLDSGRVSSNSHTSVIIHSLFIIMNFEGSR